MRQLHCRYLLLLPFVLFLCRSTCGQVMFHSGFCDREVGMYADTALFTGASQTSFFYNPVRDTKRLLINTGINFGMSVVKFGVLWVSPTSFSLWDKDQIRQTGWCNSWKENVTAGPLFDDDCFFMNWIMHPWGGGIYYMSARGSGYRWWESFIYSGLLSTFMWEYGLEAFAEVPSWNDLIVTPVAGSLLGEGFFMLKREIVENDTRILKSRFLGRTVLILMDPVNEFTDVLGYPTKHSVQVNATFGPVNLITPDRVLTSLGMHVVINF